MPTIASIHGPGLKAPKEQECKTGWPFSIAAVLFPAGYDGEVAGCRARED
jgi:hypothetical protein